VSEPNDQVVWVDKLTRKEFEAGFGSHTPMLSGPTKVVRYYPQFDKAFGLMKKLALERGCVYSASNAEVRLQSPYQRAAVEAAKTCQDLYQAVHCGDFWLCTPCHRTMDPTRPPLDGTRLTVQCLNPDTNAYELSIRTPCTPPRWKEYDAEIEALWSALITGAAEKEPDYPKLQELILNLVFYWYNFMPLARGTAASGYVSLLGLFFAIGRPVTATIPQGVQVDWEAILSQHPTDFISSVGAWLLPGSLGRADAACAVDVASLPPVGDVFPTMRAMIEGLNNDGWQI